MPRRHTILIVDDTPTNIGIISSVLKDTFRTKVATNGEKALVLASADDKPEGVWKWLDANGSKYGLHRPMPGNDPAHVQSKGDWRKLAQALKASRVQIADARAAKAKSKVVASATGR